MGNIDAPFGLKPVRHLNGMSWNGQTQKCYISSSYATALFIGDPVVITGTTAERDTTGKHLTINKATEGDGNYITGVIVAFEPLKTDLTKKHNPASTERYAYVVTDPYVIFHIRDNGLGTPDKNMPGANGVLETATAGSTATGLSGVELDLSSDVPAADASNQLTILGIADIPDNTLADFAIWEVLINLHTFRSTGDGDGSLGVLGA